MRSDIPELHAILERVAKLEAQNRRLRRGSVAILSLLSAIILMGQSAPPPRVVEAQRFILKDNEGNVRGWMGTIGKGSELSLGNVNAEPMMRLIVSTDASDLHFFGSRNSGMNLGLDSGRPDISMMRAEEKGRAGITFGNDGPALTLEDAKGFTTIVGEIQVEKRANSPARRKSAAPIVLLDKDKKVVWWP